MTYGSYPPNPQLVPPNFIAPALSGVYLFSQLPLPTTVPAGTQAFTSDQGLVYSTGTAWVSEQGSLPLTAFSITNLPTGTALNGTEILPVVQGGVAIQTTVSAIETEILPINLATEVTGILPVVNGGTGTSNPGLVAGSNVTITGTWPDQTISASENAGTVTSVALTVPSGLTVSGSPVTGSGTLAIGGILAIAAGGTGTSSPATVAGTGITVTGSFPDQTVALTTPVSVANGGTGTGTPATVAGTGISVSGSFPDQTVALTTPVSIANGGTGTTTPALVAGSGITITGSWPDQTIAASGGGGVAFSGITAGNNTTAAMEVGTGATLGAVNNALWIVSGGGGGTFFSTRNSGAGNRFVYFPATDSNLIGYTGATTYTVATLPAASSNQDQWAIVTDATAPTYGGTLTGSGSVRCPVYSDGTTWTSR